MESIEDSRVLQTLSHYQSDVNSVDFAGDYVLVTGSGDKKIRVWEWHQGVGYEEVSYSPLMGHKYGVTCVKVSPQSTMLASTSIDGTTQLWNLRTGSKIHTLVQFGGEAVRVCRFSPDSTLLVTAGDNGQVCLWDLIRRNLIRCIHRHEGAVQGVSFTPDSDWLLTSCTFGVLQIFSVSEIVESCTPSLNQTINVYASVDDAHDMGVVCCDFSILQTNIDKLQYGKTYQLVTCGNDHDIKLWNVTAVGGKTENRKMSVSIELVKILEKHSSALMCVKFSGNGKFIVSSGLDKTAVIWETSTGKVISVLRGHKRYVACCAFSKDCNILATGSNDRSVIVWDLTGNLTIESKLLRHSGTSIQSINDENKNNFEGAQEQKFVNYAESMDDNVNLIFTIDDYGGAVNSVAFCNDNLIASGAGDKLVRIWKVEKDTRKDDEATGERAYKFYEKKFSPIDGHKYSVNHVEFSPCGQMLATCSLDGTTMIWSSEDGEQARGTFVNSGYGIRVCRWSPDGTRIATAGDDEKTTIWDTETLQELKILEGHSDAITSLTFTPDSSYIATACSGGVCRIFGVSDERSTALLVFEAHDLGVQGCDFGPKCTSTTVSGMRLETSEGSPKYYTLATCGNDSYVKLWQIMNVPIDDDYSDAEEGSNKCPISYREKKILTGHGGNVMDVKFAPIHGEILGSVATDRTARIWSMNSGVCLHVLEYHESLVTSCAFSSDTSLFITGALDKTLAIWKLPQQIVSQSILIERLRSNRKKIFDWTNEDVIKWLESISLEVLQNRAAALRLTGKHLLTISEDILIAKMGVHENETLQKTFKNQLYWLKKSDDASSTDNLDDDIPDEYLCPITHEIMREPVKCSDGFIYEKAAINEWFLCGKYTSPMTNEYLEDTSITPALTLRNAICQFIHGERSDD